MKTIILALGLLLLAANSFAGDLVTNAVFNQMIKPFYNKAFSCATLEIDSETSMNVADWMDLKPEIPSLNMLLKIKAIANQAKQYTETKKGSDKVRHCYAGCYVSKKLDYTSGVMAGWLKELKDSSDCDSRTHFELSDYEATIAGAIVGAGQNSCDSFCGRKNIQNLNGSEMLEAGQSEKLKL